MEFTGERYVPNVAGIIRHEHLHRYAWCRRLIGGKDVLDIACGEGYGSAMLAHHARSVVGVDIAPDVVAHAEREYGAIANLKFLVGDAAKIPLPDGSVDVVVSFETIEHHDRHEEMIAEIRRVLRKDGFLIISSPNRIVYSEFANYHNEFHVKELDYDELDALLKKTFRSVEYFGQRPAVGSYIFKLNGDEVSGRMDVLTDNGTDVVDRAARLADPIYFMAIAGKIDEPLRRELDASLLLSEAEDLYTHHREVAGWAGRLDNELSSLGERHTDLQRDHEKAVAWAKSLESELTQANQARSMLQEEHEQLAAWGRSLESELTQANHARAALQGEHERTAAWGQSLESELTQANQARAALQEEHEQLATWGQSLESELTQANQARAALQEEHEQLATWGQSLESELTQANQARAALQEEHEQLATWGQSLESELTQANQVRAALQEEHERIAAWGQSLESELAQANQARSALQEEHDQLAAKGESLESQLLQANQARSALLEEHDRACGELDEQYRQAAQLRDALAERERYGMEMRGYASQLRQSRSWRITAPLRKVLARLRGTGSELPMPTAPRAVDLAQRRYALDDLRFESVEVPLVSIIIPTYGNLAVTLACLRSIQIAGASVPFEVLVFEDASGDLEIDALTDIPGLHYHKNVVNLGFIGSCNQAMKLARGHYICFLNNDTEVTQHWLEGLLEVFRDFTDAGLAGAKLLYPDGRLQEAGGIVWRDASAWNYGRLGDSEATEFNYVRRADYCSGAALMVPRQLFVELGGFDTHYAPAYCEDSDLAFQVRGKGLEAYYTPFSTVVHHEGVSHGTDTTSGIKAYQVVNQRKFRERWASELDKHYPNGSNVMRARDRAWNRKVVLVVDHYVPQPDRDAGSRTMMAFMECLVDAGCVVKFWPDNLYYDPVYAPRLQKMGVELLHGVRWIAGLGALLQEWGGDVDAVLLSRPDVAEKHIDVVREHSRARVVYYGHDLHFQRLQREAKVLQEPTAAEAAHGMERRERSIWRKADVVLYPSVDEAHAATALEPGADIRSVSAYAFEQFNDQAQTEGRSGIAFVAGFAHPPNVDAAEWLVQSIMPLVWAEAPDVELSLIGSNPSDRVLALAANKVEVTGFITDAELQRRYGKARVAVVPLRYGAGVKSKVVEAMQQGLPLVTTAVGAQGLPDIEQVCAICDDERTTADAILALLRDDRQWHERSKSAASFARNLFSKRAMSETLLDAMGVSTTGDKK